MSAYNIRWIWDQKVSPTQKLVLFALNEHTNMGHGDWRVWPAMRTLIALTGLGERTIQTAISEMADANLITVCAQHDPKSGRQLSNIYYLNAPFPGGEGAAAAGGRVQQLRGEGAAAAPLESSYINPLLTDVSNSKGYPPDFTAFWSRYPNKANKAAALKAWKRLNPDRALLTTILEDVAGRDWKPPYIPHAGTYLNNRRWEDEAVAVPVGEVYR